MRTWLTVVVVCTGGACTSGRIESATSELSDCEPAIIDRSSPQPWAMVSDGSYLYWLEPGGTPAHPDLTTSAFVQMPVTGGVKTVLSRGPYWLSGPRSNQLLMDSQFLYWINAPGPTVPNPAAVTGMMRLPKTGGTPTLISGAWGSYLAMDDQFIYWAGGARGVNGTGIMRIAKPQGAPVVVIDYQQLNGSIGPLAVDDDSIYVSSGGPFVDVFDTTGAWRYRLLTDPWQAAAAVDGIAVDSLYVYSVDQRMGVTMTPKTGGRPISLDRSGDWFRYLGVEEGRIYIQAFHSLAPSVGDFSVAASSAYPDLNYELWPAAFCLASDDVGVYWSGGNYTARNTYRLDKRCLSPWPYPGPVSKVDGGGASHSRQPPEANLLGPMGGASAHAPDGASPGGAGCSLAGTTGHPSAVLAFGMALLAAGLRRRRVNGPNRTWPGCLRG